MEQQQMRVNPARMPVEARKGGGTCPCAPTCPAACLLAATPLLPLTLLSLLPCPSPIQTMYNDGPRVSWGGGIMGPKSQAAQKKKERALAKDAGLRV